jgi:hypothetical protein
VLEHKSYIDDSGVQDPKVCGLAGFVGTTLQMDRLDTRWKVILNKFEVPPDKGFHSDQFFHHQGCFKGWNTDKWEAFLNQLLDAIHASRVICIGGLVDVAYFTSLSEDERRWITGGFRGRQWDSEGSPSNPYFAAFHIAITGVAKNVPMGDKVTLVFDRQTQYENKARMTYNDMLAFDIPEVSAKLSDDLIFSARLSAVVLQAADLMVYQSYQHTLKRIASGGNEVPPNYVLKKLFRNKHNVIFINKDTVKVLLADFHRRNPQGFRVKRGKKKQQFRVADKHKGV